MLANGFQFGCKYKISCGTSVIERFNSQTISYQIEFPILAIPKSNRKHADKPFYSRFHSPLFNRREHDFSVGMASPLPHAQFSSNLLEIVNFTIENDDVAAGDGKHRLVALGREVQNGKPSESQPYAGGAIMKGPRIIWATMGKSCCHLIQELKGIFRSSFGLPESNNSAHERAFP